MRTLQLLGLCITAVFWLACGRLSSSYDPLARSCGEAFPNGQRVFQIQSDGSPVRAEEVEALRLNDGDIKDRLSSRACFALNEGEQGTILVLHSNGESFAKVETAAPAGSVLPIALEPHTPLSFTTEGSSEVFRDFCQNPERIVYQQVPELDTSLHLTRFPRIADLRIMARIRPEFAPEVALPLSWVGSGTSRVSFRLPPQSAEIPGGLEKYQVELEVQDAFSKKLLSPPCTYVINKSSPLLKELSGIAYSRGMYVEWGDKKTIAFSLESEVPLSRLRLAYFSTETPGPPLKEEEYRPFQIEGKRWSLIAPKPLLSGPQRLEITIVDEAGREVRESIQLDFGRQIYMDGGVRTAVSTGDERFMLLSSYAGLVEVHDLTQASRVIFRERFDEPATQAAISEDGTRIALRFTGLSYIINLQSGRRTSLTKPLDVSELIFRPDGSQLFAVTADSAFTWFDSESGEVRLERRLAPGENYRSWHLSRDQRDLFVASGNGKILRYPLEAVNPLGEIVASCPKGRTSELAYRPEGRLLVYNCDGKLYRQSIGARNAREFLVELESPPFVLRFSHKGQQLAVGSEGGEWFVFDMDRRTQFPRSSAAALKAKYLFPAQINWLGFSPDDAFLLLGGDDGTAKLFSMQSLSLSDAMKTEGPIETGGFLQKGTRFFIGSKHGSLRFKSTHKARLLIDTKQKVHSLALSSSDLLAVGTALKKGAEPDERPGAYIFETKSGRLLRKIQHQARVNTVSFTDDGEWLLTGSEDSTAGLLHVPRGELGIINSGTKAVRRAFFSNDGQKLAVMSGSEVSIYARDQLDAPLQVLGADSWFAEAHFAGTRWISSGAADNKARIFDLSLGRTVFELEEKARVWDARISPDLSLFAHITDLPELVVRSLEKTGDGELLGGQELARIRIPSGGENLSFSPSSRSLAWSLWNGESYLFDIQTQRLRLLSCRRANFASKPHFSPDGRYVLVGQGSSAVLYRTADAKPLQVVLHPDQVSAVWMNSQELISGSIDGRVYLTALDSSEQDKASCD